MTDLTFDNPFWDFACRLYAAPSVGATCVPLQDDFSINVNILLFSAWCGMTGRRLDDADLDRIDELVGPWTEGVVVKLRQARRSWKELGEGDAVSLAGRERLKAVELFSEQIVCAMLFRSAGSAAGSAPDKACDAIVIENLDLMLRRAGVGSERRREAVGVLSSGCMALR